MYSIKLNLTVWVPGAKRVSEESCLKTKTDPETDVTTTVTDTTKCDHHQMTVKGDKGKKELIHFFTRKKELVPLVLNISNVAYKDFISNRCPQHVMFSDWLNKDKKQRLEYHLSQICHDLKGVKFTYQVFED